MPVADQLRAQKAALKFLNTQMTQSDLVAVMTYSTASKSAGFHRRPRSTDQGHPEASPSAIPEWRTAAPGDDSEGDTGAAYTQDDTEFNIFNTDRKLAALESAVKMLASLPEKKALVYFASGMSRTGIDNQAQLRATINAAHPLQRRVLPGGRARPGGHGSLGRRHPGLAGRPGHVLRQFAAHRAIQLPRPAGDAVYAGGRYRRQGAARQQRPGAGHRAGAEGHRQLLHPGLLQHQRRAGRPLPPHQGADRQKPDRQAGLPQRAISPPRNSSSSTRPTASGNCRRR